MSWPLTEFGAHCLQALMLGWLTGLPIAVGLSLGRRLRRAVHPRTLQVACYAGSFIILVSALSSWTGPASSTSSTANGPIGLAPGSTWTLALGDESVWLAGIGLAWLSGFLLLAARELHGYGVIRRLSRGWKPLHAGDWGTPLMTGTEGTAMTIGWRRPKIFISQKLLAELEPVILQQVIAHEIEHARWRDPLTTSIMRAARILLWPVVPVALLERIAREASEAAADRAALNGADDGAALDYAENLLFVALSSGRRRGLEAALASGGLEERVRRIISGPCLSRRQTLFWSVLIVVCCAAAFAMPSVSVTTASGTHRLAGTPARLDAAGSSAGQNPSPLDQPIVHRRIDRRRSVIRDVQRFRIVVPAATHGAEHDVIQRE